MKILFVVNDIDFFFSHRLPLAIKLNSKGEQVHVASNKVPDQEISGIFFHSFKIDRANTGIYNNLNSIFQLKGIIKIVNPEVVHNVTLKPILFSSLLLIFNKKIKVVNAVSGLGFLFTQKRLSISKSLIKIILRFIIKLRSPFFIFQNKEDLLEFKKLGINREYKLIKGSGVDPSDFHYAAPKQKEKVNIAFTGRILKDKGILELIQAIKLLPDNLKSKTILNIYGKIDLDNPAFIKEEQFKNLIHSEFIIWHGFAKNIIKVLLDSDIYCLPSYREGLPKSTIEAMAIGRPIITTNAPGCDDTVDEGVNGFKIKVGDAEALKNKLQILIEDEELRIQMGKKSRGLFEREFTLEKVLNQTFEIYKKLLQK